MSRELDAKVAEHVMGWKWVDVWQPEHRKALVGPRGTMPDDYPRYSTDIAAAWKVVEKLKERNLFTTVYIPVYADHGYDVNIYDKNTDCKAYYAAATAPRAICLAALNACGVEVDEAEAYDG